MVTFVSDLWGGRASDRFITQHCGVLDLIEKGDNVMADRGFEIEDLLADRKATLNIPPFRDASSTQLSAKDVEETRRIAKVRIHVERCIGRGKNYKIIENVIPLSLVPLATDLVRVCFLLVNFGPPLVDD